MANIRKLIEQLASQEKLLSDTEFLAPCIRGGSVQTSVANIIYTLTPQPPDFQGWGIFRPISNREAELIEEASLTQIAEYLNLLKPLRLRLAYLLQGQTWLAYPINESDMQQRFGSAKPVAVHLVTEGLAFEPIIARCNGNSWWFDEIDRRAKPQPTVQLRDRLNQEITPENVRFAGITPEMGTVYELVWKQTESYRQQKQQETTEGKLRQALRQGGGELDTFRDRGEYWQVEWRTADRELHSSAIAKEDLTVISSGICLSGRDRDFDLQSLVGVIEQRD